VNRQVITIVKTHKGNSGSISVRRKSEKQLSDKPSEPCALVRRFGARILEAANGAPILDVGCGAGRNAAYLAQLGGVIICLDRNSELLGQLPRVKRIVPLHLDVAKERWPFAQGQLGGILSVHCLIPALFRQFQNSLSPGGCLLIETVPAHGGNFVKLPNEGELRRAFAEAFQFEFFKEKKAGPVGCGKVTVRLLAKRVVPSTSPI
jgi:SAM-dependent methyltransferase